VCLALEAADGQWYVLVWRREESIGGHREVEVPLPALGESMVKLEVLFAEDDAHPEPAYDAGSRGLSLRMEPLDAVLLRAQPVTSTE
jgi:hypothetical protein